MNPTASTKRSVLFAGCLAIVPLGATSVGLLCWWRSQQGVTLAKVQALISKEITPMSEQRAVEQWFDRHDIHCCRFDGAPWDARGNKTMANLAGLADDQVNKTLRGDIESPRANVDLVFPGEIMIYFFFDEHDRLIGQYVDRTVFMP